MNNLLKYIRSMTDFSDYASPSIQTVLDKVEQAGGKIFAPKTQIPAEFITIIIDEGNKVGLHSEQ